LKKTCIAGLSGLLFVIACISQAAGEMPRQADTARKCAICHYRWVYTFFVERRGTPIAPFDDSRDTAGDPEMCLSCHDGSVRDSRAEICNDPVHRIGVRPSRRVIIPEKFPLDANGAMQCTTCHTPHAAAVQGDSLVDFFLRAPNPNSSFCTQCHVDQAGGKKSGNHPLDIAAAGNTAVIREAGGIFGSEPRNRIICETCHLAHGGITGSFLVLPVENTQTPFILCEACHTKNPGKGAPAGKGFSHPVDTKPGSAASVPAAWSAGDNIVLGTAGEIVCRTCHRPHQAKGKEFLLCGPAGKDALCLHCHPDQAPVAGTAHDLRLSAPGYKSSAGAPGPCSSCHAVHDAPQKEYLWAAPQGPPFLSARDRDIAGDTANLIVSLCTGCHRQDGVAARHVPRDSLHPEAFYTRAPAAAALLQKNNVCLYTREGRCSPQGGIVCATCHNAHQWRPAAAQGPGVHEEGTAATSFLRTGVARGLCAVCHGADGLFNYLHFHARTGRAQKKAPFPFGEQ